MKKFLMVVLIIALIAAFLFSFVLMFISFVASTGVFAIGATDPDNAYRFNDAYIFFIPALIVVDVFICFWIVKLIKKIFK